jgi:RNA polymerase sigma factor (sigma-70 family)
VRRAGAANPVARVPVSAPEPSGESTRPWSSTEIPVAGTVPRPSPPDGHVDPTDADAAITGLYGAHYHFLVRIAVLLGHDSATAEEVVQDSFAATCADMHLARNTEEAVSYLRAAVVSRSRWALRRGVAGQNVPRRAPDMTIAEHGEFASLERSEVMAALRRLPGRQREVVVLRYYGDLPEEQIAITMGITIGAVRRLASRAMVTLRYVLERAS